MLPHLNPESSNVHIMEASSEVISEKLSVVIPPMPVAEGIFYSADNYFEPGSTSEYVNGLGELVRPPLELLTVGNEIRMIGWILEHQGIIPPVEAA